MPFKNTPEGQTHHEHDSCNNGKGHAMNKLQELREVIIKAVPEAFARNVSFHFDTPFSGIINYRDPAIRLADVLLAIDKIKGETNRIHVRTDGVIGEPMPINPSITFVLAEWNLKENDLVKQSEETIDFLHGVLFKK